MKSKGFTLIELLAVIVILAIIAIIATPKILDVVEESRKNAAESSALGYIDAVEKQIMMNDLSTTHDEIIDGTYSIPLDDKYGVKVNGKAPTAGEIVISGKKVASYSVVMDGYTISFDGNKKTVIKGNLANATVVYRYSTDLLRIGDKIDLTNHKVTISKKKVKLEGGGYTYNNVNETNDMVGIYSTNRSDVLTINKGPDGVAQDTKKNGVYFKHKIDNNGIILKSELCVYHERYGGELCLSDPFDSNSKTTLKNYFGYNENTWTNTSGTKWVSSNNFIECDLKPYNTYCHDYAEIGTAIPSDDYNIQIGINQNSIYSSYSLRSDGTTTSFGAELSDIGSFIEIEKSTD